MSQQIKKKFLSPEVVEYFDNQIDAVEQSVTALDESKADKSHVDEKDLELSEGLSAEAIAREDADNALEARIGELESFGSQQIVHVSKNGLDTNSGGQHSPFLTITAAQDSILDASPSKRYVIKMAPGSYTESVALKANVFIVSEGQKESVRISGAISLDPSFSGNGDHRSGFSNITLLSAANFNWETVTSAAGKLYFNEVAFGQTVTMYGHTNAIAQAQFANCVMFGDLVISGVNVGVFADNVCFANVQLNQHPNGGMASILNASGGYCSGSVTLTTAVDNFGRRSAMFGRSFYMNSITIDGPSSYADLTDSSIPSAGPTVLNGGNIVYLNRADANRTLSNLEYPTAVNSPIMPANSSATNLGDWGKQWAWTFSYVHASSGSDAFLISYGSSFGADSVGRNVGIIADGAGLQENVDGGNVSISTSSSVSGTGVRGKISLDGREIDVNSKQIKNLADGSDASDAVNKSQLDGLDGKIDTEKSERIASDAQSLSDAKDYTDAQIAAIPEVKEVLESESSSAFPEAGEIGKIYVSKVDNKIYRYEEGQSGQVELPAMPTAPSLVPTISITSADDLQATINAASDGDVIFLANGTYSLSANLSISKKIALVGESQEGVLVQDTRGNSQSFVSVSVDDVTLKDMTIRHATSDSNIGHAIVVTGPGFPQARLNNFRMYGVKSQYSKGGLSIRSDNFVVEGCTFEVVAGSSTRRGVLHYGNGGDSFFKNNLFINSTTGALRAICPTSTSGSNPSDDQSGSLTIEGSTFSGNLSQFINMDNHQGAAGSFELIVKDNVTPETNAFLVSFGGAQNFGDLFSRIVLIGNNLTNSHSSGLGKGVLAIDGVGGPLAFRTSNLPVISSGNVLGQLNFRSGYAEASGSTGSIVGYSSALLEPTVEMSEGASGGSSSYVELSPTVEQDLSGIEASLVTLDGKIETEKGRIDAILMASDADKDSFAEIVALINSVDTENDSAFAGYVTSNDAALDLKASIEYVDGAIAAIPSVDLSPIEGRLDVLEAKGFAKGSLVVGAELSFIDLDKAYSVILSMSVGRLAIHEGEDYTTSLVGGVTRITWIGSLLSPDGAEAIETGDKVFWSGSY